MQPSANSNTISTMQPGLSDEIPVHDLGGRADELASTAVPYDPDEPTFHADWEREVFGMLLPILSAIKSTPGEFRHALERLAAPDYFDNGYYGRWLAGLELLAVEHGLIDRSSIFHEAIERAAPSLAPSTEQLGPAQPAEMDRVAHASARRDLTKPPRFTVGGTVTIAAPEHDGHTRRARYTVGATGTVVEIHPAEVLPDASAHHLDEHPCWVYAVRFEGHELWGDDAEPNTSITIDAYEPYLRPTSQRPAGQSQEAQSQEAQP